MSNFDISQLTPYSEDAEQAVLGSILVNPLAFTDINTILTPDDFFILRHNWIFEAMSRLSKRNEPVAYLTVIEELRTQGRLEDIGGGAYITYLANSSATSIHAEAYARIVERAAIRRRMLEAADTIAKLALKEDEPVEILIHQAEQELAKLTRKALENERGFVPIGTLMSDFYDTVSDIRAGKTAYGIPTCFASLNRIIDGYQRGELIVLGARPKVGKSTIATQMAVDMAKTGVKVGFVSLEMSGAQIVARVLSRHLQLPSSDIAKGDMNDHQFEAFTTASLLEHGELPLRIQYNGSLTVDKLESQVRLMVAQRELDILFVDYLQLLKLGGGWRNHQTETERVGHISNRLLAMAMDNQIPIVALSQLSRDSEKRPDPTPNLTDLRQSGSLEQDASVVLLMHREDLVPANKNNPHIEMGMCDVIVAKNRRGGMGTIRLKAEMQHMRFVETTTTHHSLADFEL